MRRTAAVLSALLAPLWVAGPALAQTPADRFSERAFVTAIDVVAEVRDERGQTPRDLVPSDFQLLEDGTARRIISVEYLDPSTRPAQKPESASDGEPPAWQVVVWFDAMTMSRGTLKTAGRELAKRAPALLAFGPVTVVYADISAELIIDSTRDPQKLALAIETILQRPPGDRITRLRREFLEALDAIKETDLLTERITVGAVDRSIPAYVAEEDRLLQIGRRNMTQWLARSPRRTPRMLVYVGDGFDLDPAQFYLQMLQTSGDATIDLGQTRADSQTRTKVAGDELAETLALGGWTALTIGGVNIHSTSDVTRGTGRRFSGKQSGVAPPFFFVKPDEPLVHLAEATGGERIAHPTALSGALADLGHRVRITYQVDREPDPRRRRVEIVPLRAGLTVRAAGWTSSTTNEGVAGGRAIDLLSGEGSRGDLAVTASLVPSPDDPSSPSIEARVDFGPMAQAASQIAATKVRITVAIEIQDGPPEVFHRVVDIENFGALPGLSWSAPMRLPARAGAIAVVAEELTTGSWGGARVGDPAVAAQAPPIASPAPPAPQVAARALADRAEALARALSERKLVVAFEWDARCEVCTEIERAVGAHPEIERLSQSFVMLGPSPSPGEPRVALYDPSGRLVLSWAAIPAGRKGQLSAGELAATLQKADAASPYFLRAHDLFAAGDAAEAHLASGLAYRQAGDPARAEVAYTSAALAAAGGGDASKAQTARVLGAMTVANQGRPEDALRALRAIAAAPASPLNEAEAQVVIALIRRAQGNEVDAASALDRALALAPPGTAAHETASALAAGTPGTVNLASAEASRALQVVVGGKPPFSGKTLVQVIVRNPGIASVAFHLDDKLLVTDHKPPFETSVDLGAVPRRREIRAVARDTESRIAAEDVVVVNERHDEFWIRLRPSQGTREVRVETNLPEDARLGRLEFFVDGRPARAMESDPAAIRLESSEGVVVRGVAWLEDGRQAEDAALVGATGYMETMEARDVEIYAAVLNARGTPSRTMDRSQFTIEENGRKKRLAGFEFLGRAPFSVGLAIDSSSSMLERMPDVHRSARAFLDRVVGDGSSAFVVDFDTAPRLAATRTDYLPALHDAVSRVRAEGSTALYDAVIFGLLQLQGVPGKRALIVLTDGRDETSRYDFKDAERVAQESGVAIYAIILADARAAWLPGRSYGVRGTRWGVDPDLEKLAIQTGGRAWYLPESANMDAIYRAIDLELRNQYRLTYRTAPGKGSSDWRAVKVTVDVPGATVRTAAGFVAR